MSMNQFDVELLLLEIEELFVRFRNLPQKSRAVIWAKIRIKLLEEFKDFIIQESNINQETIIEISYGNTEIQNTSKDSNIIELPIELSQEIETYCNTSLNNPTQDLFPSLENPSIEGPEKTIPNTVDDSDNIFTVKRPLKQAKQKTRLICNFCGKQYEGKNLFKKHLKRHENKRKYECANCTLRFNVKDDLIKHLKSHSIERNFKCSICSKQLVNNTTLKNHMRVIHQKSEKYFCNKCDYYSFSNHTLKEHIRIKHDKVFRKYACLICNNVFNTKVMLKIHLRSHTGEKPYQCKLCSAAFICSGRLTNHMNCVHGEKKFPCEVCEKSFKTSHKLKRHLFTHTRIKPYPCPFCSNYASNTQGNLTKHVKTVHQMSDFSYFKHKKMMLGEIEDMKEEWIRNAEPFTKEYLKNASNADQTLTVEQLKLQYLQQKKTNTRCAENNEGFNEVEELLNNIENNRLLN